MIMQSQDQSLVGIFSRDAASAAGQVGLLHGLAVHLLQHDAPDRGCVIERLHTLDLVAVDDVLLHLSQLFNRLLHPSVVAIQNLVHVEKMQYLLLLLRESSNPLLQLSFQQYDSQLWTLIAGSFGSSERATLVLALEKMLVDYALMVDNQRPEWLKAGVKASRQQGVRWINRLFECFGAVMYHQNEIVSIVRLNLMPILKAVLASQCANEEVGVGIFKVLANLVVNNEDDFREVWGILAGYIDQQGESIARTLAFEAVVFLTQQQAFLRALLALPQDQLSHSVHFAILASFKKAAKLASSSQPSLTLTEAHLVAEHFASDTSQGVSKSNPSLLLQLIADFQLMFVGSLTNYYQDCLLQNQVVPLQKRQEYRKFITIIELSQRFTLPSLTLLHSHSDRSYTILKYISLLKRVYNKPAQKQYIKLLLNAKSYHSLFKLIQTADLDLHDFTAILETIHLNESYRSRLAQLTHASHALPPAVVSSLLQANFHLRHDNLPLIAANLDRLHLFWDHIVTSLLTHPNTLNDVVSLVATNHSMHASILDSYLRHRIPELAPLLSLIPALNHAHYPLIVDILLQNSKHPMVPAILKVLLQQPIALNEHTLASIFQIIEDNQPDRIIEPVWLLGELLLKYKENDRFMKKTLGVLSDGCRVECKEVRQVSFNYLSQLMHHIGCNLEQGVQWALFSEFYIPVSQFMIKKNGSGSFEQFLQIHIKLMRIQVKLAQECPCDEMIDSHLVTANMILKEHCPAPLELVQLIASLFVQFPSVHLQNAALEECVTSLQATFTFPAKSLSTAKLIYHSIALECLSMVDVVLKSDSLPKQDLFLSLFLHILRAPSHYQKSGYTPPFHKLIAPLTCLMDKADLFDQLLASMAALNPMNVQNDTLIRLTLMKVSKKSKSPQSPSLRTWLATLCRLRWSKEYHSWYYTLKSQQLSSEKDKEVKDAIWVLAYDLAANLNLLPVLFQNHPTPDAIKQVDKFMKPSHLKLLLQNEVKALKIMHKENYHETAQILYNLTDPQYDYDIILTDQVQCNLWVQYVEMLSNFKERLIERTRKEIVDYIGGKNYDKKRGDTRLKVLGKHFKKIADKEVVIGIYKELSGLLVVNEDRECRALYGDCLMIVFNNIN